MAAKPKPQAGFSSDFRGLLARLPATAWIVLGLFLFAALLMALHTAFSAKDATLRLKVQHSFRSAELSVWIDDEQAYSGRLIGSVRKKLGLIPESVQGSFSETLPISTGKHQVRVRVAADDGSVQEDTVSGEFARDTQRTLAVTARRADLALSWQSVSGAVSESRETTPSGAPRASWLARYAGTLLLTAAGSIISAITGFALKELPKQLAHRTSTEN